MWGFISGHVESWGKGAPQLLTKCYDQKGKPDGSVGPFDPTVMSTYEFMLTLLTEVFHVFPDRYVHLGGDEVPSGCWCVVWLIPIIVAKYI